MNRKSFILKGNICHSRDLQRLEIVEQGYLVCEDGVSQGIFHEIPERYQGLEVLDFRHNLIIPGLTDLHVHAPQYSFRSLGMDLELIEWLETHAFVEEMKFADQAYAEAAYELFVSDLTRGATTRACIFATVHQEATALLADRLEKSGIISYIGKVSMDRNAPESLREADARQAAAAVRDWLKLFEERGYKRVRPILTPRFIPACSDELMAYLAGIQAEYQLPLQSHLSENPGEISWVQKLCPESLSYGDAYDRAGLFGGQTPAIMAHCVYPSDIDLELMQQRNVTVAHCPNSNTNLSSGIAPVRTYLDLGIPVGLGSDVAGGTTTSIFRAMADAIQVSKLYWRLVDENCKPLTVEEAFYLGTRGGGSFFGSTGCFEAGYEFDAVVLCDDDIPAIGELSVRERLERMIYLSDERHVLQKFIGGERITQ